MGNQLTKETKVEKNNNAILDYSNGERYVGEIVLGLREGFGTYHYQNGEKYEGHWLKNAKNGKK